MRKPRNPKIIGKGSGPEMKTISTSVALTCAAGTCQHERSAGSILWSSTPSAPGNPSVCDCGALGLKPRSRFCVVLLVRTVLNLLSLHHDDLGLGYSSCFALRPETKPCPGSTWTLRRPRISERTRQPAGLESRNDSSKSSAVAVTVAAAVGSSSSSSSNSSSSSR